MSSRAQGSGGGGSRQGQNQSKPGDWQCKVCKSNNFAKNVDCFRCHVPKTGGGGGGGSTTRGFGTTPVGGSRTQSGSGGAIGSLAQGVQRLNVQDYGRREGHGSGGSGLAYHGGGIGRGRSTTHVEFPSRPDPPCLQNFLAKMKAQKTDKEYHGWNKSFITDEKCVNTLPLRKKNSRVKNSDQVATILLNHYQVNIKLPKFIYHYRVDIERKRKVEGKDIGATDKGPTPGPSKTSVGGAKKKGGNRKQDPKSAAGSGSVSGDTPGGVNQRILPTFIRKAILKYLVQEMHRNKNYGHSYGIITDFSEAVYTIKKLESAGQGLDIEVDGGQAIGPEEEGTIFTVHITATAGTIDTTTLQSVINNMQGVTITPEMVNLEKVYSTLMRCLQLSIFTPMRRADLINYGAQRHFLGGGVVSYPGYSITLPITNGWKKFINIEISNMATYLDGPVENVLANLFGYKPEECRDVTQWTADDIDRATSLLKTCKITYSPNRHQTFSKVVVRLLPSSVSQTKFRIEGEKVDTSVFDYFKKTHNRTLRDPNGACLELKGGKSPKVPVELCSLKSGQSFNRKLDDRQVTKIAEVAKKDPGDGHDRRTNEFKVGLHTAINNAITDLQLNDANSLLNAYGVSLANKDANDKMHQIRASVLAAPELCYGKRTSSADNSKRGCLVPENGEWDIWNVDMEFFTVDHVSKWGVLNLHGYTNDNDVRSFAKLLIEKAGTRGIKIKEPSLVRHLVNLADSERGWVTNVPVLSKTLQEFQKELGPENLMTFVLVILPRKGSELYNHVKQAAELEVGILTQCIVEKNVKDVRKLGSIVGNILLKINSKLNKVNHIVAEQPKFPGSFTLFNLPVMVIGADVTHPPPGMSTLKKLDGKEVEIGPPSYAAITASIDRTCMPYMMHVQAQRKPNKEAAEVINGLDEIICRFLQTYRERTGGYWPVKIIYFRDGVGDGQFQEVLRTEMSAIRKGCTRYENGYEPKITFITVQKRHKTRFFLKTNSGIKNAQPGTVVDTDIVHPVENDFYLLSHQGLLGTSRPSRYHVLWDDSDLPLNEIQTLAYFLCYMFVRCNRSVKIPAPTYYAHWAAKRAEVLAKGWEQNYWDDIPRLNDQLRRRDTQNNFATNFPMHFV